MLVNLSSLTYYLYICYQIFTRTLQGVVDKGLVYREGSNLSMSTLAQRREEAEFIANIIRPFVTGVWVGR